MSSELLAQFSCSMKDLYKRDSSINYGCLERF